MMVVDDKHCESCEEKPKKTAFSNITNNLQSKPKTHCQQNTGLNQGQKWKVLYWPSQKANLNQTEQHFTSISHPKLTITERSCNTSIESITKEKIQSFVYIGVYIMMCLM